MVMSNYATGVIMLLFSIAPPTTIPHHVCDAVFCELHSELRQYLNFHTIYPFLKQHNLLLSSQDHCVFTNPRITREQKVDNMISWLPKCKMADYLSPFVLCLKESAAEAGIAHTELAESIERQLAVELKANRIGVWCGGVICTYIATYPIKVS